jgi:hypothetical protein
MRSVPALMVVFALAGCPSGSGPGGPIQTGDPSDGNRNLGETCDPTLGSMACAGASLGCCPPAGCLGDAGCADNPLCRSLDGGACPG